MEAFSGLYLVVLGVSLLLLVVALVFGFGHDSDFSPEVDSEIDADVGGGTAHLESDGPSWLSSRVILGAAAGFGAFGLGAQAVGLVGWITVPVALVGFFAMAFLVRQLVIAPLWRQQHNGLLSRGQYVGSRGRVTLGIRSDETGLVLFVDPNGTPVTDYAVRAGGGELPAGTEVMVVDVTAEHVVVDPDPLSTEGK